MSCDMWFGTQDFSTWFQTPQRGADVGARGWEDSGVFLNGGSFARHSFNSHKEYTFSWRTTSDRKEAQMMTSFYSGSFGRGKLYFLDPLTMDTNVLPARWADPSITCDFEGESLVPGIDPLRIGATDTDRLQLPVFAAQYTFRSYSQTDPEASGVFVPVPPGYVALVYAVGSATGSAAPGVNVQRVAVGGSLSGVGTSVPLLPPEGVQFQTDGLVVELDPGQIGFRLWFGGAAIDDTVTGTLTVNAMRVAIAPVDQLDRLATRPVEHWYGGQGNEGVRFMQPPTYINNTGRDGGQIEFSATFTEVAF